MEAPDFDPGLTALVALVAAAWLAVWALGVLAFFSPWSATIGAFFRARLEPPTTAVLRSAHRLLLARASRMPRRREHALTAVNLDEAQHRLGARQFLDELATHAHRAVCALAIGHVLLGVLVTVRAWRTARLPLARAVAHGAVTVAFGPAALLGLRALELRAERGLADAAEPVSLAVISDDHRGLPQAASSAGAAADRPGRLLGGPLGDAAARRRPQRAMTTPVAA